MIVDRQLDIAAFARMIVDNMDELLEQRRTPPLVMGIALHPYLVGQPYRLRQLREALEHVARARDRGAMDDHARGDLPHVDGLGCRTRWHRSVGQDRHERGSEPDTGRLGASRTRQGRVFHPIAVPQSQARHEDALTSRRRAESIARFSRA